MNLVSIDGHLHFFEMILMMIVIFVPIAFGANHQKIKDEGGYTFSHIVECLFMGICISVVVAFLWQGAFHSWLPPQYLSPLEIYLVLALFVVPLTLYLLHTGARHYTKNTPNERSFWQAFKSDWKAEIFISLIATTVIWAIVVNMGVR